jgi:hypothetical protein
MMTAVAFTCADCRAPVNPEREPEGRIPLHQQIDGRMQPIVVCTGCFTIRRPGQKPIRRPWSEN